MIQIQSELLDRSSYIYVTLRYVVWLVSDAMSSLTASPEFILLLHYVNHSELRLHLPVGWVRSNVLAVGYNDCCLLAEYEAMCSLWDTMIVAYLLSILWAIIKVNKNGTQIEKIFIYFHYKTLNYNKTTWNNY